MQSRKTKKTLMVRQHNDGLAEEQDCSFQLHDCPLVSCQSLVAQ